MIKGFFRFGTGVTILMIGRHDVWFDSEFQGPFEGKFEKINMPLGIHEVIVAPVGTNPAGKQVSYFDMEGEIVETKTWHPLFTKENT